MKVTINSNENETLSLSREQVTSVLDQLYHHWELIEPMVLRLYLPEDKYKAFFVDTVAIEGDGIEVFLIENTYHRSRDDATDSHTFSLDVLFHSVEHYKELIRAEDEKIEAERVRKLKEAEKHNRQMKQEYEASQRETYERLKKLYEE